MFLQTLRLRKMDQLLNCKSSQNRLHFIIIINTVFFFFKMIICFFFKGSKYEARECVNVQPCNPYGALVSQSKSNV